MRASRGRPRRCALARQTLLALIMLFLIVMPAHAQTGKVLLDMTIQTLSGSPSGHCLYVDDGRFFVEARLTGEAHTPVRFNLGPAPYGPPNLNLRVSTTEASNGIVQVVAGTYCYLITGDVTTNGEDASDNASQLGQSVTLRIIWLPRP